MSLRSLAALAFLAATGSTLSAQTMITALPYTINSPGTYRLASNLTSSAEFLITINSSNVDLDLGGFGIQGILPGSSIGVYAIKVSNVRVRNGRIANVATGIAISQAPRTVIENLCVDTCLNYAIACDVACPGTIVRNNDVTLKEPSDPKDATTCISTNGGVRIENNVVVGWPGGSGIRAWSGDFVIGNTVSNCRFGIVNGKYLNNLTYNCTTPFSGGIGATGNN